MRLLRDHPPRDLSMRAVARLAGVTPNAPYRHFASREQLLAAVAESGFAMLRDRMFAIGGVGEKRVASMCTGYLAFAREHPHLYRLMFGTDMHALDASESLARTADEAFHTLVDAVAAAWSLPPERAMTEAVVHWSTVHGYAMLELDGVLGCCPAKLLPKPDQFARRPRGS